MIGRWQRGAYATGGLAFWASASSRHWRLPTLWASDPLSTSRCAGHSPNINAEADETRAEQWVEEATEKCPGVPIILVGLKKDLREDPVAVEEMRKKSLRFVTEHDGEAAAREVGAKKYLECSSLSGEGVDDVFEAATRAALLTFEKGEGGGCCVIL